MSAKNYVVDTKFLHCITQVVMSSCKFLLSAAIICILSVCARIEWSHGAYIGRDLFGKPYNGANERRGLADSPKYYKVPRYRADEDKRAFAEEPTEGRPTQPLVNLNGASRQGNQLNLAG